jgi:hypothetical protein
MKENKVILQTLGLELPMVETRTKHIAIKVAFDGQVFPPLGEHGPGAASEDLLVYYAEEGGLPLLHHVYEATEKELDFVNATGSRPNTGPRGVHRRDPRGEISERRARELQKAARQQRHQDQRSWRALRQDFSLAEQWATRDFQDTVIFEPFGGSFGVTRTASREFSWDNSQPLDIVDGYDLVSPGGHQLVQRVLQEHRPYLVVVAFPCRIWSSLMNLSKNDAYLKLRRGIGKRTLKLVCWLARQQHQMGRYYLIENPANSAAWGFENLFKKLLDETGGAFVVGDQCAYGATGQAADLFASQQGGFPIARPC